MNVHWCAHRYMDDVNRPGAVGAAWGHSPAVVWASSRHVELFIGQDPDSADVRRRVDVAISLMRVRQVGRCVRTRFSDVGSV